MHEIPSLALVVLGYASPLDYSHFNLWIMWGRPREQKKMVFPSANKIFSHLSVGIWMSSHCRGVPYNFCFADCPGQFPCSANAGRAVWSCRTQQAGRDSRAPLLLRWVGQVADTGTILPRSTGQCQCPDSGSSLRSPRTEAVTPLLQANTFAPFSNLACACGGRSFGSSTALSEARLWVPSVPFLGTAGAGRGTDFTGTVCPTWHLALPWPTSTTMGTPTHQGWVLQFSASLAENLAY